LARLVIGARAIGLELPFSASELTRIVTDTVRAFAQQEAYVRLLVTRGEGPLGVDPTTCKNPTVICIVAEIGLFDSEQRARGLSMITSSYRRPSPDVPVQAVLCVCPSPHRRSGHRGRSPDLTPASLQATSTMDQLRTPLRCGSFWCVAVMDPWHIRK